MNRLKRRVEKLPILLDELHHNLLNDDELIDPQKAKLRKLLDLDLSKLSRQEEELEVIRSIENFITYMLISKDLPFEKQLWDDSESMDGKMEQLFFTFNKVFMHKPIRSERQGYFSTDIQYSLDLELFIKCFNFAENNAYEFFKKNFNIRSINRLRGVTHALQSTTYALQRKLSNKFYTDTLGLHEKRIICGASEIFYESLISKAQTTALNTINSNCSARHRSACEYVANLFDQYKVLTFIALDLCFSRSMREVRGGDVPQDILKRFKNKIRQNTILSKMVGFLGKWEYSHSKQIYVRMIFVLEKLEKSSESVFLDIIGNLWKDSFENEEGFYQYAFLASGNSKLNATLCTISAKQEKLRKELEERTLYYLAYAQSYYRYQDSTSETLNFSDEKCSTSNFNIPRDLFFKEELPTDVVAAKKAMKEKNKKIKANKLLEKERREAENKKLELVKGNFLYLMKKI